MDEREPEYLSDLNLEQREACKCLQNLLLTACPGSGKTRTLAYKIAYLNNAFPDSNKLHIAITYTNRAADEIMTRLENIGVDDKNIWIGTIHQFCMRFIIRPYSMYSNKLRKGYRIIDEYIQRKYKIEIAKSLGINCGFSSFDNYPRIVQMYKERIAKNKEIDFDGILECSLDIVSNNPFVAKNISSIIASIQVDEYQDTNEMQYQILSKIYYFNTKIIVSFIGDVNQAIYGNLGGVAKSREEICELFNSKFEEKHLTGCYRSVQKIIDFYSNFAVNNISVSSLRNDGVKGTIILEQCVKKEKLAEYIAYIIKDKQKKGISEDDICIVAPQWYLIYPLANDLRRMLPFVHFDAPDITPFKRDNMNPFYLIAKLSFERPGRKSKTRKKRAREIIEILKNDYDVKIRNGYDCYDLLEAINSIPKPLDEDGIECYKRVVVNIFDSLSVDLNDEPQLNECYVQFLEKTYSRINENKLSKTCADLFGCFDEKQGVVISTIHGVKGEEYKTVIAFGLLNGYLPYKKIMNCQSDRRKEEVFRLLYVLCSRAKDDIFLIGESDVYKSGEHYTLTDELAEVEWDYDSYIEL